ncbi:MAG TPA: glucosyl-3-phosphoglycerate synthase [Acidimicrobiales bacterium]|nr:glucosyl-3-phosphoglycerate synthase [Acidimicrobiales bacterium]
MRRSHVWTDYPAARVQAAKRGRRVSVCIPARDEAETLGQIVDCIRRDLVEAVPVVDEILVMDDGSTDDTAAVAESAGATVRSTLEVLPEYPAHGKGQAMWKGVHAASGDLIVFCDADIRDFHAGFVLGLAGPLLQRDDAAFAKGFYERAGGRVTELMARPLISVFFPHLADLAQPLSGECAAPRSVLEALPFAGGYGVDLALLIDVTARFGNHSLVQCDLGTRVHRNRALSELGPQSLAILQLALERAGVAEDDVPWSTTLLRPQTDPVEVQHTELPPLVEVPAHRKTA